MIKIDVKKNGGLDKSIKKLKWKFDKNQTIKVLKLKQFFTKKSVKRRDEIKKASYKESKILK
jgi:small subunit ribosomal protein S21